MMNTVAPAAANAIFHTAMPKTDAPDSESASTAAITKPSSALRMEVTGKAGPLVAW